MLNTKHTCSCCTSKTCCRVCKQLRHFPGNEACPIFQLQKNLTTYFKAEDILSGVFFYPSKIDPLVWTASWQNISFSISTPLNANIKTVIMSRKALVMNDIGIIFHKLKMFLYSLCCKIFTPQSDMILFCLLIFFHIMSSFFVCFSRDSILFLDI